MLHLASFRRRAGDFEQCGDLAASEGLALRRECTKNVNVIETTVFDETSPNLVKTIMM